MSDENKPAREKASNIPSWIMVGFVLGALVIYTFRDYLPHSKPAPQPEPPAPLSTSSTLAAPATSVTSATTSTPPSKQTSDAPKTIPELNLANMDTIFRKWAVNARWDYNTAQIAFYNFSDNKFSTYVEVTRRQAPGGEYDYFYRAIPALTRPYAKQPVRTDTLVLFTEVPEDAQ